MANQQVVGSWRNCQVTLLAIVLPQLSCQSVLIARLTASGEISNTPPIHVGLNNSAFGPHTRYLRPAVRLTRAVAKMRVSNTRPFGHFCQEGATLVCNGSYSILPLFTTKKPQKVT